MSVVDFYDQLAENYHLIFKDWRDSVQRQGRILNNLVRMHLPAAPNVTLYDCSCGIGTQALGLAQQGYHVHATDISPVAVERARQEAINFGVDTNISFGIADFRSLDTDVEGMFDVVLSCDNSLPHLLTDDDLTLAARNMREKLNPGGLLLISTRNYDDIILQRPTTDPLRVYGDSDGNRRISFQIWDWEANSTIYTVNHFIISGQTEWHTQYRQTQYRALRRSELTTILTDAGFQDIQWHMPERTSYFQQIVTARNHAP